MKIREKFNYSNVASSVALVIAVSGVGGVAYAAGVANNSVGSPQIKDGQVKTVDLGKAAVTGKKVKAGSIGQSHLNKAARTAFTAGAKAYYDELNFHNISSDNAGHDDLRVRGAGRQLPRVGVRQHHQQRRRRR